MKLDFSRHIFEKYSNVKYYENPSSGSRVVPCGQMDERIDGQTDMTKPIVAFRNFAKAPETVGLKWTTPVAWNVHVLVPFRSVPFTALSQSEIIELYKG